MHLGLLVIWFVFGVLLVLILVDFQCSRSNCKQRQIGKLQEGTGKKRKLIWHAHLLWHLHAQESRIIYLAIKHILGILWHRSVSLFIFFISFFMLTTNFSILFWFRVFCTTQSRKKYTKLKLESIDVYRYTMQSNMVSFDCLLLVNSLTLSHRMWLSVWDQIQFIPKKRRWRR